MTVQRDDSITLGGSEDASEQVVVSIFLPSHRDVTDPELRPVLRLSF
jgi:hypothetical protein